VVVRALQVWGVLDTAAIVRAVGGDAGAGIAVCPEGAAGAGGRGEAAWLRWEVARLLGELARAGVVVRDGAGWRWQRVEARIGGMRAAVENACDDPPTAIGVTVARRLARVLAGRRIAGHRG
jgi:hypothetical protein